MHALAIGGSLGQLCKSCLASEQRAFENPTVTLCPTFFFSLCGCLELPD
jgi:hypothetical protein